MKEWMKFGVSPTRRRTWRVEGGIFCQLFGRDSKVENKFKQKIYTCSMQLRNLLHLPLFNWEQLIPMPYYSIMGICSIVRVQALSLNLGPVGSLSRWRWVLFALLADCIGRSKALVDTMVVFWKGGRKSGSFDLPVGSRGTYRARLEMVFISTRLWTGVAHLCESEGKI